MAKEAITYSDPHAAMKAYEAKVASMPKATARLDVLEVLE